MALTPEMIADIKGTNKPQKTKGLTPEMIADIRDNLAIPQGKWTPEMEKQTRDILGRGVQYGWAPIAVGLKYADKPRAMGAATVNKVITGGKSNWREDVGRNMSYGEIADKALAKTDLSPKAKRWLGAGIGFAADVLLDPVMWVTGGGSKVKDVTKAAKAFDALKDAYGAEKALQIINETEKGLKLKNAISGANASVKIKVDKIGDAAKALNFFTKSKEGMQFAKELNIADDIAKLKDAPNAAEAFQKMIKAKQGSELAAKLGVSDDLVKLAAKSKGIGMADSLADKAKAGQWAVAHIGRATTPKGFNTKVGGALDKAYGKWINLPIVNRMVHTTGNPEADRALTAVKVRDREQRRLIGEAFDKNTADIAAIEKATGKKVTTSELEKRGVSWLNGGGSKEENALAKRIADMDAGQIERYNAKSTGRKIKSLTDKDYFSMSHELTDNGSNNQHVMQSLMSRDVGNNPVDKSVHAFQRKYVKIQDPNTKSWNIGNLYEAQREAKKAGFAGKLKTKQATVDEINDYIKSLHDVDNFFSNDAAGSTLNRQLSMQRAISKADELDALLQASKDVYAPLHPSMFYRKPKIDAAMQALNDEGKIRDLYSGLLKPLSERRVNNALATKIESAVKGLTNVNEPVSKAKEMAMKAGDVYNDIFRQSALFLRPAYHERNWVGDASNMMVSGMTPANIATDLKDSYKMLGAKEGVLHTPLYGDISFADLAKKAEDHGIKDSDFLSSFAKQATALDNLPVEGTAEGAKGLLQKIANGYAKEREMAQNFGRAISLNGEEARHGAKFIRGLKEGQSYEQAARGVFDTLFDYGNLTDWEKNVRKVYPFYAYPRNNAVFYTKAALEHPGRMQFFPRAKYAIESGMNEDPIIPEEKRPAWMRGNMSVQIGKDDKGNPNFLRVGDLLSPANAFQYNPGEGALDAAINNIGSNALPILSMIPKIARNKDYFRDAPLDRLEDAGDGLSDKILGVDTTNYLGMNMPAKLPTIINSVTGTGPLLQLADKLNPFNVFGKERPNHTELSLPQKLSTFAIAKNNPVDMGNELYWREKDMEKMLNTLYNRESKAAEEGAPTDRLNKKIARKEAEQDRMFDIDDLILKYYPGSY